LSFHTRGERNRLPLCSQGIILHHLFLLDLIPRALVVMNINTMTFAARGFLARRGARCFRTGRHIPQWIGKERATKSGRKRTAALRVAPNLACGCLARRLQRTDDEVEGIDFSVSDGTYASSPFTTRPCTSVSRWLRPWNLNVSRVWSMPRQCSIVACRS
jgi:hypothetical protein